MVTRCQISDEKRGKVSVKTQLLPFFLVALNTAWGRRSAKFQSVNFGKTQRYSKAGIDGMAFEWICCVFEVLNVRKWELSSSK